MKKLVLEISQNSQENICARVSFLIKLQASGLKKGGLTVRQFAKVSLLVLVLQTP